MREPLPSVSIVIPARNEEGNLEHIFQTIPVLCAHQELIFIEGNSSDNTWEALHSFAAHYHTKWPRTVLLKQDGKGKADAVWKGISEASGDIIIILDADITVPPESLRDFYEPFAQGTAGFVFGSRLVYPMEKGAMQLCNYGANVLFALLWRPILQYRITDTLCGTKAFLRKDYEKCKKDFPHVFTSDPYGDFALLFTAATQCPTVKEVPILYKARQYGVSNISRWNGGIRLLKLYVLCLRTFLLRKR